MTSTTEFYVWSQAARLAVTLFFAVCLLSQTISALLSIYRRRDSLRRIVENALEFAILAQILVCSMLHGQVIQAAAVWLIPASGYVELRIAIFAMLALIAAILSVMVRTPRYLVIILAAGVTLPFMEPLTGKAFAYIYLAMALFWFVRSIGAALLHYREIISDLSAVSVKNAIDSLRTGVMFCEKDGFILLVNEKMQQLMIELTEMMHRNGRWFYERLASGKTRADCEIKWLEDRSVCLMLDGSVWNFSATELQIGRKDYFQLTASDITERWRLTEELRSKNSELLRRQKELSELISDIHNLAYERETQKAKMRAHDVLSHRLTLLLRNIRNEQSLDFALLRSLSHGLMDDLKTVSRSLSPQEELDALISIFGSVGVKVVIDGALPEYCDYGWHMTDSVGRMGDSGRRLADREGHIAASGGYMGDHSRLLIEIIQEAVTNAVRHGFATEVNVRISDQQQFCQLQITDNGYPPSEPIIEGGGISGIRDKVKAVYDDIGILVGCVAVGGAIGYAAGGTVGGTVAGAVGGTVGGATGDAAGGTAGGTVDGKVGGTVAGTVIVDVNPRFVLTVTLPKAVTASRVN